MASHKEQQVDTTAGMGCRLAMCLGISLMISITQAAVAQENATVVTAASKSRNLADILGTSHARPLYQLTNQDILNESADQVLKLGMRVIKVWLSNGSPTRPMTRPLATTTNRKCSAGRSTTSPKTCPTVPDSPQFGNKNVSLGEYGLPENSQHKVRNLKAIRTVDSDDK